MGSGQFEISTSSVSAHHCSRRIRESPSHDRTLIGVHMLTNSQKAVAPAPPASISRVVSTAAMKGTHVHNFAGEDLGKVDDFVINFETGRIAYVAVSQGGFLGI